MSEKREGQNRIFDDELSEDESVKNCTSIGTEFSKEIFNEFTNSNQDQKEDIEKMYAEPKRDPQEYAERNYCQSRETSSRMSSEKISSINFKKPSPEDIEKMYAELKRDPQEYAKKNHYQSRETSSKMSLKHIPSINFKKKSPKGQKKR